MTEEEDDLIECGDDHCTIHWHHMKYLRINEITKVKWFCPDCKKGKIDKINQCNSSYNMIYFPLENCYKIYQVEYFRTA